MKTRRVFVVFALTAVLALAGGSPVAGGSSPNPTPPSFGS